MLDYQQFLDIKRSPIHTFGFVVEGDVLHPSLFPFQRSLCAWSIDKGRSALFADTGMGKTLMQLVWADQVVQRTNGNVLILTPLAVSHQTIAEGQRFGIEVHRSMTGNVKRGITVTNYERLHYFDPADFTGMVCDESAILKSFDGATRAAITVFMKRLPYRLLCSATPAPNDYIELGTSSEALGYLGYIDMLNRFFKNDKNNSASGRAYGKIVEWRFKGHAEEPFWRWVTSWARAIRKPSDMGYDDNGFILPPLLERQHVVEARNPSQETLFPLEAITLREQRDERRRTLAERCEMAAALVNHNNPAIAWCYLNDEGNLLESLIPDAVQVSGSEPDESKEEKLIAFANGEARVLVTKPIIAGWGLNFQHCAHMTFFPSHSFEQYYQATRRCWRFGQRNPVVVDIVTTPGERRVLNNLQKKAEAANRMFTSLVAYMNDSLSVQRRDGFDQREEIPSWL